MAKKMRMSCSSSTKSMISRVAAVFLSVAPARLGVHVGLQPAGLGVWSLLRTAAIQLAPHHVYVVPGASLLLHHSVNVSIVYLMLLHRAVFQLSPYCLQR